MMEDLLNIVREPWPWYIAGPIIGLMVPLLLLVDNRKFGISSSFRHICAAIIPTSVNYFKYDWKKSWWSLVFVAGVIIGGALSSTVLANPNPVALSDEAVLQLAKMGLEQNGNSLLPAGIFSWDMLLTLKGFILIVVGGFLVGFGTRYADGCTSGHSITGIALFRYESLVATICFFIGGLVMTHFILPTILAL